MKKGVRERMKRLIPMVLVAAMAVIGCATRLSYVKEGSALNDQGAYVAGRFYEKPGFLQFSSRIQILIQDTADPSKRYWMPFRLNDEMQSLEIPPGEYLFERIYAVETRQTAGGGTSSTYINVVLPDALLVPFRVKPGEILYVGDLQLKKKWYVIFTRYQLERSADATKAAADLRGRFSVPASLAFTPAI